MSRKNPKVLWGGKSTATAADADLLSRCLDGEAQAREEFVEKIGGLISWALAVTFRRYGRLLEDEDLEDFRQELLLALFHDGARKLRQYDGRNGASLATWLRVVATRFAIDRIRRFASGARFESLATGLLERTVEAASEEPGEPEAAALQAERRRQVLSLIAELSPGDQLFVRLFYYQDATIAEVSEVMGISRNAAYVRKMRLHRRLRSLLEQRS
jgi:RNA polymerase sigma-70 factor (ECF subfamily)